MSLETEMRARLMDAFAPDQLEIRDDSESHRGHAGFREGGETHWWVRIKADVLTAQSRIDRHRAVHQALGPDIIDRIHALEIKIVA
jgi:BolA protein